MYGSDPPLSLIEKMLDHAASEYSDEVEAIFMLGDFIEHDFIIGEDGITKEHKFEVITAMWSNLTQLVSKKFPDVPVIIALGNNDNLENYIPPTESLWKQDMFSYLCKAWMEDIPANLAGKSDEEVLEMQTSFMAGGYYKYSLDSVKGLSNIVLNANYWSVNDREFVDPSQEAWDQLTWLEATLKANRDLPEEERDMFIL